MGKEKMTGIVELEEKSVAHDDNFVSYELLMSEEESAEEMVDPLAELRQEQERIKAENEELIARTQAEVARIEQEAYDKGYAAGVEQGKKEGKESFDEKISQTAQLIADLQSKTSQVTLAYEEQLLPLIKAMVDKLVYHEMSVNPLVIEKCLHKAMAHVVATSRVCVHLHPDDFNHIKDLTLERPELLPASDNLELMEDPAISQGGCLLETDFGTIDATLETGRENLYKAIDQAFLAALSET